MIATLTGASFTRNPKYSRITNPMKISRIRMNLRSEEHTSELQSPCNLVCRLLLEKKKNKIGVASGDGDRFGGTDTDVSADVQLGLALVTIAAESLLCVYHTDVNMRRSVFVCILDA